MKEDTHMFVRIKKSGKYEYLQIVKSERHYEGARQIVMASLGRLDKYTEGITLNELGHSFIQLYKRLRTP